MLVGGDRLPSRVMLVRSEEEKLEYGPRLERVD